MQSTQGFDEGNEVYRNFIQSLRAERTRIGYRDALSRFMAHLGIDSVDALLMGGDVKAIQNAIIGWLVYLKNERKLAYATRTSYLSGVMHFYLMNDIELNRKKLGAFLGEAGKSVEERPYTKQEIRQLLQLCDSRMKAVILLLASSGPAWSTHIFSSMTR